LETTKIAQVRTSEQEQKGSMENIEAQYMTSHPSTTSGERRVMKIATKALDFPTTELQEHAKALSHIDSVLSQFPIEVLHGLQMSVTQEIKLCAMSTSMELTKAVTYKDGL
jgi:hypothetical protein